MKESILTRKPFGMKFKLQPFKDIYFHSDQIKGSGDSPHGNSRNIYIYSIVALLIMLTASFNYILLSTSRSEQRLKEIRSPNDCRSEQIINYQADIGRNNFYFSYRSSIWNINNRIVLPYFSHPLFNKLLTINYIQNWHFTIGLIIVNNFNRGWLRVIPAVRILSSKPMIF